MRYTPELLEHRGKQRKNRNITKHISIFEGKYNIDALKNPQVRKFAAGVGMKIRPHVNCENSF